ncbi:MAG: hypothetical protein ISS78_03490 [Phycisphaerae bacterium]|nr:hypothetical protein [Phycisphaerae bacterium]
MERRVGIIASGRQWRDRGRVVGFPHRHLFEGLKRIGREPMVVAGGQWPLLTEPVEAVFLWNGTKGRAGEYARRFRQQGTVVFVMEHGWFDRRRHVQIDHKSFAHAASWATREHFDSPALQKGRMRFRRAFGRLPKPLKSAKTRPGYILVLLQVPGDSQLRDSEIGSPGPLVRAVEAAAPAGCEIQVRPHPLHEWTCHPKGRARTMGGPLSEAVEGATFCVTINSTAGIESLALGCPVLCLGPALYATAGVALQTSLADMPAAMAKMAQGWSACGGTTKAVHNFLYHLACRQWSFDEIAEGSVLRGLWV